MQNFYSISTSDFRPISFGSVYLYGEYEKIKNFLAANNKTEFIQILAIPSYKNDVIEWKAKSSGDIRKLDTFSKTQQDKILSQYNDFVASFNSFINTLSSSKNKDNSSWGELLTSLIEGSANELFYDGENIFITWGWRLLDENSKKLIPIYVPPVKLDTSPSVIEDVVEAEPIPVMPVEEPEVIEEEEPSWLDKIYLFLKRLWWLVPMLSVIILILVLLKLCGDCDPACTDIDDRLHDIDMILDNCDCCECLIEGCTDRKYKEYNPHAHVDDGSCKTKKEGEELIDCPERRLVFQVCNSNAEVDDNFDVYLNDIYIGKLDLNKDRKVGSVFIAAKEDYNISEPDFPCSMRDMKVYKFDPSIIKYGKNYLLMKNTRNNGNGNLGTIGLRTYLIEGGNLVSPCKIKNLEYKGDSGRDFKLRFYYTDCCP